MTYTTSTAIAKRVASVTGADERVLARTVMVMAREWGWGSMKIYNRLIATLSK